MPDDRGVLIGREVMGVRLIRTGDVNELGIPTLVEVELGSLRRSWAQYAVDYAKFLKDLREVYRSLRGSAGLSSHDGFEMTVSAEPLGGMRVAIEVSRPGLELTAHFDIDQSFLPKIIQGLDREFRPPYSL